MKISKFWYILFSLIIIAQVSVSCANKHSKQTTEFSNYLYSNFSQKIARRKCTYVILPSNQCFNCFKNIDPLNTFWADSVIIITSINPSHFCKFKNLLFDSSDNLKRLSLIKHDNTIIVTENYSITIIENNIHLDKIRKL